MSRTMFPSNPDVLREIVEGWLSGLERPSKQLSAWELNFLESVHDQFSRTGALSTRQFEVLEGIYAEKTS